MKKTQIKALERKAAIVRQHAKVQFVAKVKALGLKRGEDESPEDFQKRATLELETCKPNRRTRRADAALQKQVKKWVKPKRSVSTSNPPTAPEPSPDPTSTEQKSDATSDTPAPASETAS